jgi:DNA primase
MSTNNTIVSDIESRIDIVELIREYVPLKKSGTNWKWLSPFKPEKTASFVVSPAKQIAYCFATNQGGGPLKMLMLLEKIEFREALQILAKRAGVELKTDTVADGKADEKSTLIKLYTEVSLWYQQELWKSEWLEARNYLSKRGLTKKTIEQWWIGYSSDPREMFEAMKKKGFSEKILMESGIFVSQYKDRFFGRVTFPISNYRGEVIAFSWRTLKVWSDEAKYVNSPETLVFHKSDVLFGIHHAKNSIQKEKKVIIVEGQMDVITLHQHGITNVVWISGTALTDAHIRLIRRLTDQVYLCLDRDSAGKQAIFRSIENLQNEPVDIYVINIWEAKDPDEFLKNGGDFTQSIEDAIPAVSFIIEEGSTKYDISTNQGKKWLMNEVIQHILAIRGNVEIDQALRLLGKKLDMSLQTLYSEYNRAVRGQKRPSVDVSTPSLISGQEYLVTYIVGLREGREIFLRECLFQDTVLADTSMLEVSNILAWTLDPDAIKAHELRFEEISHGKTIDKLFREFRDLIRGINQTTFRKLQKEYAHDLPKLQELIQVARKNQLI